MPPRGPITAIGMRWPVVNPQSCQRPRSPVRPLKNVECFLKESLFDYLIAGMFLVQLFDGDDATGRVDVFGFENRAKSAAADIVSDLITADTSAAHNCVPKSAAGLALPIEEGLLLNFSRILTHATTSVSILIPHRLRV
jgi:hypothetical protein